MSDLISKEELLHIVGGMSLAWEYGKAVSDIYEIIKNMPTIEAVERIKIIDELVNKAMHEFTVLEHHERYQTVRDCKIILRDVAEQMKGGAEC